MDDVQRAREALSYIPAHDRDTWCRMGMALHDGFGDTGFDLWDEWAQTADNHKPGASKTTWKGLREGGGITLASLFYEAKQGGWTPSGKYQPREMTAEEKAERERRAKEAREQDERDAARARKQAAQIIQAAKPLRPENGYMVSRGVEPTDTLREIPAEDVARILGYAPKHEDVELTGPLVVVPIKAEGGIVGVELIDEQGNKTVPYGTVVKGGYWAPAKLPEGDGFRLLIGEGVATMLSARAATADACISARYAANVPVVAEAMRQRHPVAEIVILGEKGGGLRFAEQAARAVGGKLAVFDGDANDTHRAQGLEAVRKAIEAAQPPAPAEAQPSPANRSGAILAGEWPEPAPLTRRAERSAYPLHRLPGQIGAAVAEALQSTQCPPALAAHAALCAVSLACQGLANVRRTEALSGSISIFALILCDSGERKSSVEDQFTRGIRAWQTEQQEAMKGDVREYLANLDAWKAQREGLLAKIRDCAKRDGGGSVEAEGLRQTLIAHDATVPKGPLVPYLIYMEPTPEALMHGLVSKWPCGAILTAEAGNFFGGHGMKADSLLKFLALLNVLWDGGVISAERRSVETLTIDGARLTVGLAVQPDTMRAYMEKTNGAARGTGLLARFLVACPESTQGQRAFRDPPKDSPSLRAFNTRLVALLEMPLTRDSAGRLSPVVLSLDAEAKAAWVQFYNDVEAELGPGGDMEDARDIASKAADNAARLAALFHVFEQGPTGTIGAAHMQAATEIVSWHLYEARRFFTEAVPTKETANAEKLEAWLVKHFRETGEQRAKTQVVLNKGPGSIRHREDLDAALRELSKSGRARTTKEGRTEFIELHPQIMGGEHGAP